MFDTKIYHQFGCKCLRCHRSDCFCEYHIGRTDFTEQYQRIIEKIFTVKDFMMVKKKHLKHLKKKK